MFTFTPLAGARSASTASQSLLELDGGIKILVDVGWDERLDPEQLKAIAEVTPSLSFILLTHATIDHLGAYAHCCKHIPHFTSVPVYATRPVAALGRTLLQDLYASTPLAATVIPRAALLEATLSSAFAANGSQPMVLLQPPSTEEIVLYFAKIEALEYSQPHQPRSPFSPSIDGLTITAFNAGHTLGGSIWHIQYNLETIVYAVDWTQARENLLSGADWLGRGGEVIEQLRRPTALVCSTKGAGSQPVSGGRKKRDDTLLSMVHETIANGGTVIIPTDSSARVLELAYILEHHWRRETAGSHSALYKKARLALASKTADSTLRLARSMLSWMDESIGRDMTFENDRDAAEGRGKGPFDFRHVKTIQRSARLEKILTDDRPGVILASDKSLRWGFAKLALRRLCADPKNLVILTERFLPTEPDHDIVRTLWQQWEQRLQGTGDVVRSSTSSLGFENVTAARLEGDELTYYQQYLTRQRRVHGTDQDDDALAKDRTIDAVESDSSSSSESGDDNEETTQQGRALNTTASMTQVKRRADLTDAELGVSILIRSKGVFDYDVRGKKGRDKLFPFVVKRTKADEFGETIGPADYLRAEEKDDLEGVTLKDDVQNGVQTIGRKRKFGDATTQNDQTRYGRAGTDSKRSKHDGPNGHGTEMGGRGDRSAADDFDSSDDSDYDADAALTPDGPLKAMISIDEPVILAMGVGFVDFSSLHEKRDLHMLIPLIAPRRLILTGGQSSETDVLAQDCTALLSSGQESDKDAKTTQVFSPSVNETVDASVDTNAFDVKLSRELVKRLAWQHVLGLSVVAVTGRLDAGAVDHDGEETGALPDKQDAMARANPVLDVLATATGVAHTVSTQPIHVGDLRLADLRRWMQASGLRAEFRGEGTLLIDGSVVVRKSAGGTIEVEGSPAVSGGRARGQQQKEATFFAVRQRIYEGLAVVAGV